MYAETGIVTADIDGEGIFAHVVTLGDAVTDGLAGPLLSLPANFLIVILEQPSIL